jgi:hypothetical protein
MASITIFRTPQGEPLEHVCSGPCETCKSAIEIEVQVHAEVSHGVLLSIEPEARGWPVALTAEEQAEAVDAVEWWWSRERGFAPVHAVGGVEVRS